MQKNFHDIYEKTIEVRWADCDANQHMRHSAYADMCAHTRMAYVEQLGMDKNWYQQQGLSPILFKEQTEYFAEVFLYEKVRVTMQWGEPTGSAKSVCWMNSVYKENGKLAVRHSAVVSWMNSELRKVVELPALITIRRAQDLQLQVA